MFSDCQIAVWYATSKRKICQSEDSLRKAAQIVQRRGTNPRSNWRTPGETWKKIASFRSSFTGKQVFDFLKGKTILEATTSDGGSADFLRRNKDFFGFAYVLGCDDFFEYNSLKNRQF